MPNPKIAPYGSWKSPISSEAIVSDTVRLGQVAVDGRDTYWVEMRPSEGGRNVLVRRTADGQTSDVTPAPFNVRTRVHEYGGGAFVVHKGTVYFSNFDDQRLLRQTPGSKPQPLTPPGRFRYADAVADPDRNRLVCIREDHSSGGREAVNAIVSLELKAHDHGQLLVSGNDFYSSPGLSPDGTRLAYLTWNHPNMPWDGTELWVADLGEDGSLASSKRIAGGPAESVFQPRWSPDGTLYFVSDRTGWWNLYCWQNGRIEPVRNMAAEFGRPEWVFGMSTYAFASDERLICSYAQNGSWHLAELDPESGDFETLELPFTEIESVQAVRDRAVFVAGSPELASAIVELDLSTRKFKILRKSSNLNMDAGYFSTPQAIEFPTEDHGTAYAFFYPPQNRDYVAPPGERPPLIVKSHGGPTGAASASLDLKVQFWTSRGFAVLDVNYRGSSGFGREYRQRLNHRWGIVDVDDCVNGAQHLITQGLVDGGRLAIVGGSAGGYTTLAALIFRDFFQAGASYYGVCDLEALAKDTHKFESRYLDRLIGPYPERRDLYLQRSPIHFTDRLSCPVILFQGLEDKVVPPNQAEMMVEAVRKKGLPVAYLLFEGEQHGFRKAENIKRALEAELYFYSKIFGFPIADEIEPVQIDNL